MSEQDEFLKDLPLDGEQETDEFGQPIEKAPEKEKEGEESKMHKNREFRRLEKKYQEERESSIALSARLQALSETQKFREESGVEKPDETIARIYGTNTPEGIEATRLLQSALDTREQRAVDKALEKFREEQETTQAEYRKELDTLNEIEERIEDEYDFDFSSEQGKAVSKAYFSYLERMSPKDADGNVKDYADPFATWEEFQSKRSQTSQQTNRAKDLGSRSMVRSGSSNPSKLEQSVQERYLIENGLI